MIHKRKRLNKLNIIKLKTSPLQKTNRKGKEAIDWEETFAQYIYDRRLVSKMYF